MGFGWWKACGIALACGVTSEIVYMSYKWFKKRKAIRGDKNESRSGKYIIEEVLFFPDREIACKDFFISDEGCHNTRCRYTHDANSLSRLYEFLHDARRTLDVCVFVICCVELADILILASKRNVVVRVICDDEQIDITGSQIWKLRQNGINVRTDNSSYLMHNKFVIIDGQTLLNGSFNWTRQAISGNQENIVALNNRRIVSLYKAEFEKLWTQFTPSKSS